MNASKLRPAFTLIEIMVVIAIIGILSAIALLVGNRVTQGARINLTKDLLKSIDQGLTSYLSEREGKAPSIYRDANGNEFPVFDGRTGGNGAPTAATTPAENSLGLLLLATDQDASLTGAILRADSKFVSNTSVTSTMTNFPAANLTKVPLLKDPWGNTIRFVHPKYQGGYGTWFKPDGTAGTPARPTLSLNFKTTGGGSTMFDLRRSYRPGNGANDIGDADEGLCSGGRAYFYSPGPDKDPGTRSDNVYIDTPIFPTETAKFYPPSN